MAMLLKERRFIKSDIANNNNKFWYIELYDDATVITKNGRVGDKGQVHPKTFGGDQSAAERFFESKIKEKTGDRKGYTELKVVIGAVTESQSVVKSSLADIAVKQINTNDNTVQKLIKYLSKKNIHNIISATTITYDESKGTFSTPCGIVTQDGIDEARDILNKLAPCIENNDFSNSNFTSLIQQYIQIIPRKTARKLILEEVIPEEKLNEEYQILDALSASLQEVMSAPASETNDKKKSDDPKIFSVSLDVVNDQKVIDHIIKFYNKTRNSMHTSSSLHVNKVYAVKINHMYDAFEKKGKSIGNIMELWHGTRVENVLSILKSGLIIPPANASQCSGRMFGNGLYFSDQSTKSLNYAQGYWGHGSTDNNCFMFLADVAMGKYYVPTYCQSNIPHGYNSFFAKANQSGVRNNEMIVPHLYQANLKYLVEFTD